jgi:hypothetical protein
MMTKILVSLLLLTLYIVYAQNGAGASGAYDPVSYGMANTYVASSRGIYALGKNPANLSQGSVLKNNFSLDLYIPIIPAINFSLYRNFLSIEELKYFFGGVYDGNGNLVGRTLTASDKQKFKDIFKDNAKMEFGLNFTPLAFTINPSKDIGSFGFAINHRLVSDLTLPADLFNLLIDNFTLGDEENAQKVYSMKNLNTKAGYFVDYNISYSRLIPEIKIDYLKNISAGISLKFVNGLAYSQTKSTNLSVITKNENNIVTTTIINNSSLLISTSPDIKIKYDFDSTSSNGDSKISPFSKPAGTGLGFDIGFSAKSQDDLFLFGFAITDIGSIKWKENVVIYQANRTKVITSFTDKNQTENLGDSLKYKGKYTGAFTTSLPTALRLGIATELQKFIPEIPGRLLAEFNYNQGFNDELGNSTIPRFSLGFDWYIPSKWLPYIRTGFSAGGKYGFNWAFGLGFDTGVWELDIATLDLYTLFAPNSSRKFNFAIGNRWKF